MLILIFFIWIIFYGVKGIILKEDSAKKVLMIITLATGVLCIYLNSFLSPGFIKTYLFIYFGFSLYNYIRITFLNKDMIIIPYFSRVYIRDKEVVILYTLFKPLLIIGLNIYLYIKKIPLVTFDDEIRVDINTKEGQSIDILL